MTPPKNTWTNDTVKRLFRNSNTSRSFITTCLFLRPLPTPDKPIWVDEWLLFYESKMYWSEMVRVHLMNNRYRDNSRPVVLISSPGDTLAPAGVLYDVINDVINQMRSSQVRKDPPLYLRVGHSGFSLSPSFWVEGMHVSIRKHGRWKKNPLTKKVGYIKYRAVLNILL